MRCISLKADICPAVPFLISSSRSLQQELQQHLCVQKTPQSNMDHCWYAANKQSRITLFCITTFTNTGGPKCSVDFACVRVNSVTVRQTWKQQTSTQSWLLTSVIILQLLQGPICVKSCSIKISVTSLERFPTYLQKKCVQIVKKFSTANNRQRYIYLQPNTDTTRFWYYLIGSD